MPGPFFAMKSGVSSLVSRSTVFPPLIVLLSILTTTSSLGCRPAVQGSVDIDAIRQKSIAEGKADPIPNSPTTPEARKARAVMLLQEAKEKTAKHP